MDIAKKPYEISLWEETLVFIGESGASYEDITKAEEAIVNQYYKETRLCTIGSSSMESLARCVNPKLVSKVNGENTLTFTMYYQYIDTETGEKTYNPFVKYMVNERKVKLNYDGKWYDFVIKQIQENSETRAFTYTCKDQFMVELSKTGFDIVLDNELENNMGTVKQLAETILEGSDWRLAESDNLMQFVEEPLYKIKVDNTAELRAEVMNPINNEAAPNIAGKYIYVFYSHINDQKQDLQFLYDASGEFETNDDLIINKDKYPNYLIKGVQFTEPDSRGNVWPDFTASGSIENSYDAVISSDYRGMRLVRQIQTKYDSTIDKFVQVYKKEGDDSTIYYGFTNTEYVSPNAVSNLIVNPNAFTNTVGWYTEKTNGARPILELAMDPPVNSENIIQDGVIFTNYLKLPANGSRLMNSSINSHKSGLEEFIANQTEFVLRIKYKNGSVTSEEYSTTAPNVKLGRYNFDAVNDKYEFVKLENGQDDVLFDFVKQNEVPPTNETEQSSNYIYMKATCARSVSKAELKDWENRYGLFFTFDGTSDIFIEDVQLFPYLKYDGKLCVPGGELFSEVKTTQKYYKPSKTYTSIDNVIFEPDGGTYILQYNEGANAYTKVASITAKESNRFNLLQDLNEKFECWARFNIEHNDDGSIKLGKDVGILTGDEAYRQQKFVSFHEYAGREEFNYVGFRYGTNSKSIQRTLDSNAITSKLIVKDNANEFAPNGFCSIARASENPTRENFLLNFDHYYHQGLLDLDVVTNDLYVDANGYLGYYKKLRQINKNRDANIDLQANLLKDITNYDSSYQTYKLSYDAAVEERQVAEDNIRLLIVPKEQREEYADKTFEEIVGTFASSWEEEESYIKNITKWAQCKNVETQHKPLYEKAEEYLEGAKAQFDSISAQLKEQTEQKRALNLQFYKKYSRFIQEGSWIKEDYVDDNLYYLDSVSTLHTSAQPKVTYNISVIDISQIPGFEDYVFELGDKTYIEDVEFFGYSLIDREAPYREEIVVSEMTFELDSPEKNQIKVQNYKTQFEDLFQRITAQTQQAEYHTGEYKRAASIVETDGTIALSTLENSFSNNSLKLQNARDQSVVIDEYGITSTSLANPSEMVRIVAGGIFMSTDGGQSWKTGLTGHGLNSSYLTAGQINTDKIYIMNNSQPAFRWDEKGLSAYSLSNELYNLNKYVRFDQYGIYGAVGDDDWSPSGLEDIHNNARFALTWNGFSLKNAYGNGYVSINSEQDLIVNDGGQNRIQIGNINNNKDRNDNPIYGIRISNANGDPIMVTHNGELWLQNRLRVGENNQSTVEIGYLDTTLSGIDDATIRAVIKAGDDKQKFIVYENGFVEATGADISGTIHAEDGTIGCVNISKDQLEVLNEERQVLIIDNTGLTVNDAGFRVKIGGQEVFGVVQQEDRAVLAIKGTINALGGSIGGFTINEDSLVSNDGNSIRLNGKTGEIVADNIQIGKQALITEYIKFSSELGNAYLCNPAFEDKNIGIENGTILKTSGMTIRSDGTGSFGNIIIDGISSTLKGKNWYISSQKAEFENIIASGAIKTSVFETESTQAVGGAMVFMPSYKIDSYNIQNKTIVLEKIDETVIAGQAGWLVDRNNNYVETTIVSKDGNILILSKIEDGKEYVSFIIIGNTTMDLKPLVIGINSGDSVIANGLVYSRGLTINEYGNTGLPKVFLGDLSKLVSDQGTYSGYGLYSNNAYLTGSLTTETYENSSYAGINTSNGTIATRLPDEFGDNSKIVFWGGAPGPGQEDQATFQVTERGSVYASNAYFVDSVFAGGSIQGADLYAARIHGGEKDNSAALTIYDTAKGIIFKASYNTATEIETLTINSNGITAKEQDVSLKFLAPTTQVVEEAVTTNWINFSSQGMSYIQKDSSSDSVEKILSNIYLSDKQIALNINGATAISSSSGQVDIYTPLKLQNIMKYTRVDGGCDLYVFEQEEVGA